MNLDDLVKQFKTWVRLFQDHAHTGTDSQQISDQNIIPFVIAGKMSASSMATANATWAKIPFNVSVISSNITTDITNNRITVPVTGTYKLDGESSIDSLTSGNIFELRTRVNGTEISYATARVISASSSLISYVSLSTILNLNAGDYVELWVFQQTGAFNTGSINTISLYKI